MQSLIHGNFTGTAQAKAYALVGASAAIAAAIGPLLGSFLTTYLSWRVGFMLEAVVIVVVLLAALSIAFTDKAESSKVLTPAEQQRVADALEEDAQLMSNAQLEEVLAGQPEDVREEIVAINADARPLALQIALLVPLLAGVLGLLVSFRMVRLPEPTPVPRSGS